MRTQDMQIVHTEGTALERAEQFGEAVREGMQAWIGMLEPLRERFASQSRVQKIADRMLKRFHALNPPMEIQEACCRAAGVTAEQVHECATLQAIGKSRLDTECSGVVLKKSGKVILGQNLDTGTECGEINFLEVGSGPDTDGFARFCPPHMLECMFGLSPSGIASGGASGPGHDPLREGHGSGMFLTRWLFFYRCETVAEIGATAGREIVVGKGSNGVWVGADGRVIRMEQGGGALAVDYPIEDWAVATGHRAHLCGDELGWRDDAKAAAEEARLRRFNELAGDAAGTAGDPVEDMKRILADHQTVDGHPASAPCRHGGEEAGDTQFSCILDLTERVVHYCGQPCCNEWGTIPLQDRG
ncbi:MAG: hypothetical protein R6V07_08235 [Armatimonadota bacterium]